nr:MAG TPA: hypothetical protein [Crassvirales sp.]
MPAGTPNIGFINIPPTTVPVNVRGLVLIKSKIVCIPAYVASRNPYLYPVIDCTICENIVEKPPTRATTGLIPRLTAVIKFLDNDKNTVELNVIVLPKRLKLNTLVFIRLLYKFISKNFFAV